MGFWRVFLFFEYRKNINLAVALGHENEPEFHLGFDTGLKLRTIYHGYGPTRRSKLTRGQVGSTRVFGFRTVCLNLLSSVEPLCNNRSLTSFSSSLWLDSEARSLRVPTRV